MRKYLKKALILIMLSFALIAFGIEFFDFDGSKVIAQDPYEVLHEHRFNALPTPNIPESNYITYTEFRNEIGTTSNNILSIDPQTWGKTLRIDSAEELYRFSIDVSYNMTYTTYETKLTQPAIERLLSFDYALGNDIDYSVMKSKRFNPIGYQFEIEEITYDQSFKGTFDGNGFEISNLYLSGYSQLTEKLNEGTEFETTVSYIEYYSMFAYNEGTIQNLGLINPTFEFTFESETLFKASNLVGRNEDDGHVHHVYVIDTRASALIAGIRMVTSAGQAAGVMFENHGSFHDAYFVSRVVINASYGSRFSVQPVLYENHIGGDAYNLAFDDTLYQEIVTISGSSYNITTPNLLAESMTSVALRSQNTVLGSGWYYYPAENNPTAKYPSLLGLETGLGSFEIVLSDDPTDKVIASTYFIIESAIDLIAFSKMLNYTREAGLTPYRELNYIITTSIDMSSIANNAYITPSVEFSGIFAGANNDIFIYGLDIVNGTVQDGYFSGMFGILSGQVYNLLFYDATILLDETDDYASIPTYVGLIAGQLVNGKIRNILVEIDIDLGHATLGELHVGAIVGQASGVVSSIYGEGIIQANNDHVFRTDIVINPVYQLGGLVGSSGTQQLILTDAYNQVDIHGIGTSSTSINATSSPIIHMGGVIGRVTYTVEANHVLGLLTNTAELSVNELKSDYSEVQFVGGVIGTSSGTTYTLYNATGKFMSMGTINVLNRGTNQIVASGVLTSNHSEEVEFIHLYNQSSSHLQYYTVNPGNGQVTGDFGNLSYTSLVYNIGQGVVLSQSRNNANIEIYGNYDYSGVYHSVNQAASLLRFVTNNGDITFQNQTMGSTRMFAGITLSQNVDFLNVTYDGIIRISNILMQTSGSDKELFVAGITHTLTNGKYMKNSMVHGEIKLAGITSNEVDRTQKNNIYVGGFVVYNRSGNMDPNGTLPMPKATIGIINSINSADITSTYTSSIRGIIGHANVFVGGIASFNDGDIQDSANLGDIRFENLSNVDNTNVEFSQSTSTGGAVEKYRYGVIAGGISAAVMSYRSRIYDSSNSGTVIALSRNFSRAGGILAIATFLELKVGNIQLFYTDANNNIQNSILSNCINYGNISALTISISTYTNQNSTFSLNVRYDATQPVSWYTGGWFGTTIYINTTTSTQERPGIHASSGGVIGYGLSVMRRMVNHGQVSSSDVAGGVVGATFVLTTIGVKIDTAINYGTVRAFNSETVQNFYDVDIMDYDTIRDGFYAVDDPFIFPSTRSDIRLFPENKRGFGGIFGRLQRALSQVMYGNGTNGSIFNFIVNMDPNVDLIGRLDQVYNYTSSVSFFDFTGAKYYSARKDDTTQAVFTGYTYFTRSNSVALYRITQNISIDSQKYEYSYDSQSGQWMRTTYWQPTNRIEINLRGRKFTKIGQAGATSQNNQTEIISRSAGPTFGGSGWQLVAGSQIAVGTLNEYKYIYDLPLYNQVWDIESTKINGSSSQTTITTNGTYFGLSFPIPIITEESIDLEGQFIYSPTFEMQTDPTLQQYIYYSENGNLSPTFQDSRPNGMYVLSTSSGSTFGSILPANMLFDKLLPLALGDQGELPSYDIDYDEYVRISPADDPTYMDLLEGYEGLFQTLYSDKSVLLDNNQSSLKLIEIEGSMSKLHLPAVVQPSIGNPAGVITFNINLALLDFDGGSTSTVHYHIRDALLPNHAVIAKTIEDYYGLPYGSNITPYISSYRALLEDYVDPNLDPSEKPDLDPVFSYTFDKDNLITGNIVIGHFTSYSQVSQYFTSFLNDSYVTDYIVRLNVTNYTSPTLPYLYSYQIDSSSANTNIVTDITTPQVYNTIRFNFRDPNTVPTLPTGTDILELGTYERDNVTLEYYDEVTETYVFVEYEDYTLTSILSTLTTNRPFSFTIGLNPSMKSGQYRVGFRLLPYQENRDYYTFIKGASSLGNITGIEHYSSGEVVPSGTSIVSYVNFGYAFDFSSTQLTSVQNEDAKAYQTTNAYYTLPFLERLEISDFASITNVVINSMTYQANGFRTYNISYTVLAENGTSSTVYTHQIRERAISIVDVYRNNNKVVMNQSSPVVVSREALSTAVSVNYGIDPTYSDSIYNLETDDPTSYFTIAPTEVEGITFSVTNSYLVFTVDSSASAGNYAFDIGYYRDGESVISLGTLYIQKSLGTNAYLSDIQFAELATETNYAMIYVSDSEGDIDTTSTYSPSIYFAGIDYDGSDSVGTTNFRVDGQVSNIPLDEYIPYFLNYLPLGASIAKKDSEGIYSSEILGPDDENLYQLAADFTSSEGSENDEIIITYRVTSEDGLNMVYYHITVTDITYNVSYIFEVIYEGNTLQPNLIDVVIAINVRNMSTNLPVGDAIVTVLPEFSTVTGYNNSTNLLFMLDNENYKFRFGRNKSGYYSFNVDVLDAQGYVYDLEIELNGTDPLANISDYDLNSNDEGKYYYINSSIQNRTRNFTITISNARIADRDYGFVDHDASWDVEEE